MAGGTWTTQNKVRPNVYINFQSEPMALGTVGERGIATIPLVLPWGAEGKVITIEAGEDTTPKLGYPITAQELLLVREALKRAKTLLVYRVNTGVKATSTSGELVVTAKHSGSRGNNITIVVEENIDNSSLFDVKTLVDGVEQDVQTVADIAGLQANDWVTFNTTGDLTETAGMPLEGGKDGTATNQNYLDYLAAIETYDFNTMALPVTDNILKGAYISFCKRLRDDEGRKIQIVVENYSQADYEGVISVKNGVVIADGTTLTAEQCTAWVAGATAGANVNQSLTYSAYDDAVDVSPRYTNSQIITALLNGEFVFTANENRALVEQDINTFTSFVPDKGRQFSKNRVIRVLDNIGNDFYRIFSNFYLGKISNNLDGRNLLKGECINYLETLQGIAAIQNFDSQTDISVLHGNESDSVYIETYIQPVDSIEKIYFLIRIG